MGIVERSPFWRGISDQERGWRDEPILRCLSLPAVTRKACGYCQDRCRPQLTRRRRRADAPKADAFPRSHACVDALEQCAPSLGNDADLRGAYAGPTFMVIARAAPHDLGP